MTTLPAPVQTKLEELCQAILAHPDYESMRLQVDRFLVDDSARGQYARVSEQGEHLHHKQSQGVPLADAEIAEFEREREALLKNPVARGFLDAQERLQDVQASVNRFVGKALELGRVPAPTDLESGCGHGCGCGHSH
jgi:cell fate (sporulation/competence/biofilm development) regulator YlbF (YheA/YmcA/DUF963 family)